MITGAGGGIGEATAHLFSEQGAAVIVVDLNAEDAHSVVSSTPIAATAPTAVIADITVEADTERMVREAEHQFGPIDLLINTAAVRVPPGPITELAADDWRLTLDVNLMGAVYSSKYVARSMIRNERRGAIVHVSSVGALGGRHGWAPYDASKAALLSLTRDMACDLAPHGIRVNAVCPGHTLTKFHVRNLAAERKISYREAEERLRESGASNLLRRQADPREIEYSILFLASEESSFVTGASFCIDGGQPDGFQSHVPTPRVT